MKWSAPLDSIECTEEDEQKLEELSPKPVNDWNKAPAQNPSIGMTTRLTSTQKKVMDGDPRPYLPRNGILYHPRSQSTKKNQFLWTRSLSAKFVSKKTSPTEDVLMEPDGIMLQQNAPTVISISSQKKKNTRPKNKTRSM